MNKRVGILGLLCAAAVGFFHPAVASAQDRDGYRRGGYEQREYRDRDDRGNGWRRDDRFREHEWREARERQEWREREWRERERYERGYDRRYAPVYSYGYGGPVVDFDFRFNRR